MCLYIQASTSEVYLVFDVKNQAGGKAKTSVLGANGRPTAGGKIELSVKEPVNAIMEVKRSLPQLVKWHAARALSSCTAQKALFQVKTSQSVDKKSGHVMLFLVCISLHILQRSHFRFEHTQRRPSSQITRLGISRCQSHSLALHKP